MRIFFVSTFVGTFLPASIGSDAVRAYSILKLDVSGGDAVASVLMDRILGVASIMVMAVVGLTLFREIAGNRPILAALAVVGVLCAMTMLLVFSARAASLAAACIRGLPFARVRHVGQRVVESIRKYAGHPQQLVAVLVCSIAVQAFESFRRIIWAAGSVSTLPFRPISPSFRSSCW